MSINITHIITTIDIGGAEKQLLSLSDQQHKKGNKVKIIYLKGHSDLKSNFESSKIIVNSAFASYSFFSQIIKLRKMRFRENEIIHAHLPRAELLCALALKPKSFIVTRHNSERFFPKAPALISKYLSNFVLKRAFALISISKAVEFYLESSNEARSCTNRFVIHYGIPSLFVTPRPKKIIDSKSIHIGTVARLTSQKNLQLLLHATRYLNDRLTKTYLTIVGSGPMEKELKLLAKYLELNDLITWQGQEPDIVSFYNSIDGFILPSNYEGFGLVLLEAMSHGVPIVARRISAIPEVLGESHPGLFESTEPKELAETVFSLLSNQAKLKLCLVHQSRQIQLFPISKSQEAHNNVYRKFLIERRII